MPIEPKTRTSSSYLSPRSKKVRIHARAQYVLRVIIGGSPSRAPRNAGSIEPDERVFGELLRTPSRRNAHDCISRNALRAIY